jgi:hypothetical protein
MTDQQELGVVGSYADLHRLLRSRADDLNLSRLEIDRLANLAPGHAAKLLSPRPLRRLGNETMPFLLSALGVRLVLQVDPDALERIKRIAKPREPGRARLNGVTSLVFHRRHYQRMGRLGGAKRRFLSPEERTRLARKAGLASAEARRKRRPGDRARCHAGTR